MRQEKAITLIALVVTIIVLLILAGVALNATVGQNGIIQRSKEAANVYRNAETDEQTQMNSLDGELKNIIDASNGAGSGSGGSEPEVDVPPTYIPNNFSKLTGTIETGYVVSDTYGNELVWVPVNGTDLRLERTFFSEVARNYLDNGVTSFINSVNQYKGFYIARYEAGIPEDATTILSVSGLSGVTPVRERTATPISKKNAVPWNSISQSKALSNSALFATTYIGDDTIKSELINSYAWDTTLQWIIATPGNDVDETAAQSNSTSWGNYSDATVTGVTKYSTDSGLTFSTVEATEKANGTSWILATGNSEYTAKNNIYDLAGNLSEWTTELYSSSQDETSVSRVYRGGVFNYYGYRYPAGCRTQFDNTDFGTEHLGYRFIVYKMAS